MDYKKLINKKLQKLVANVDSMRPEERAVMRAILIGWNQGRPVTQLEIAESERWLGCHEKYEADIVPEKKKRQSSLRKVRQVIRNLRIERGVPIISSRKGYTLPCSEAEATEYIESLEKQAKARARASFETYNAMREALNLRQSNFFEAMRDE